MKKLIFILLTLCTACTPVFISCAEDPPENLGPPLRYHFNWDGTWNGPFDHNLQTVMPLVPCPENYNWSGWHSSNGHDTSYIEFGPALPPIGFCCAGTYRVVYERGRHKQIQGNPKN